MKAKEYAQRVKDDSYSVESVKQLIQDLLGEITSIAKARNISKVSSMESVIRETRQKWIAVCNRAEGLNKDGFDKFLVKHGLLGEDLTLSMGILMKMGA